MKFLKRMFRRGGFFGDYKGDGFATKGKNLGFMHDPRFAAAYEWSAHAKFLGKQSPWTRVDLRWRAHLCVWAATQALSIEGDFVECGVDTAVLSGTVTKYLDFAKLDRAFFLMDTYTGIPDVGGMSASERSIRALLNEKFYFDSFDYVTAKMAEYANVHLVKGLLPDTLDAIEGRKIAYLSIDLNNAPSEKAVMERIWPQLSPGAVVVIDDYAFVGHEAQYEMWNDFAARHKLMIATLPTGQGILVHPG